MRLCFFWIVLCCCAWAQDLEGFLETLTPARAEVFRRAVVIEANPSWWIYLNQNSRAFAPGLAGALVRLGKNMGLGPTPAGWDGRISVNLKFPPAVNDEPSRQKLLQNLNYVWLPVQEAGYCLPRAGRFGLTVKFDVKVTAMSGYVSPDGASYDLTSPIYATLYTSQLQEFFKKGL